MNTEEKFTVPSTQFVENPEGYVLKASLPGIAKEDTELHVEGKTLVLKAHSRYQNPAGFRQVATEFEHESYAMSADLPEMADVGTLTAKLENGLLTVTIKKRPETQPGEPSANTPNPLARTFAPPSTSLLRYLLAALTRSLSVSRSAEAGEPSRADGRG